MTPSCCADFGTKLGLPCWDDEKVVLNGNAHLEFLATNAKVAGVYVLLTSRTLECSTVELLCQ